MLCDLYALMCWNIYLILVIKKKLYPINVMSIKEIWQNIYFRLCIYATKIIIKFVMSCLQTFHWFSVPFFVGWHKHYNWRLFVVCQFIDLLKVTIKFRTVTTVRWCTGTYPSRTPVLPWSLSAPSPGNAHTRVYTVTSRFNSLFRTLLQLPSFLTEHINSMCTFFHGTSTKCV
jgi:hypothetical protein